MKAEALPELRQQRIEEARAQRIAELRKRASIHYPAEMPNAMKNAPAAVVNGFVFPAGILGPEDEPHGGVTRAVTPPKKLLEQTINTLLVVLEAERIGITDRPELRTNLALKRMDVLAQLKLRGESGGVAVTDAELRQEYQRYYTQDTYEFQFIVTPSRERAAKALQRSRAGEEFDALAQEYNTGLLAKNKGVVPLGSPSVQPASVQAALPLLKDGEVSEVLDLGNGSWGVIKRTSQQFFLPPPFEQVSDKIRRRLELQKSSDRVMALAAEYEKKLNVTFNESLLAKP
jgi:hypothetical protein